MLTTIRCLSSRANGFKRFLCSTVQPPTVDSHVREPPQHSPPTPPTPSSERPIIGSFQSIPKDVYERLFSVNGFEPFSSELFEVLDDQSIMVRSPYLQTIDYIERTDFNRPANRYVIWGRHGAGKTFTLNHLAVYGFNNGYCLIHLASPKDWLDDPAEIEVSESRPGRLDFPLNAALALRHFKNQNSLIIANLTVSQTYTWSVREETKKGEPLVNIIDHGISRMKHSSDCYAALLKELKIAANAGQVRLMVLVNDVNLLYGKPKVRHPDKRVSSVEELTLPRALMKFFNPDWKNGLVIASTFVEQTNWNNRLASYYPKNILGDRGWEAFDPFIPIKVANYSDMEADSCLDYYTDRLLLQRPQTKTLEGREEIKVINARNPFEMYKFCTNL